MFCKAFTQCWWTGQSYWIARFGLLKFSELKFHFHGIFFLWWCSQVRTTSLNFFASSLTWGIFFFCCYAEDAAAIMEARACVTGRDIVGQIIVIRCSTSRWEGCAENVKEEQRWRRKEQADTQEYMNAVSLQSVLVGHDSRYKPHSPHK